MSSLNLINSVDVRYAGDAVSAGSSTDDNGDIIDTAGYEGVLFTCPITDSAETGVATMTVEQNTANSGSGMAALGSAAVAAATSAADDDLNDKFLIVDIRHPRERYLRVNRTSATANIAFGAVTAILYGAKKMPVTVAASADSTVAVSTAEA